MSDQELESNDDRDDRSFIDYAARKRSIVRMLLAWSAGSGVILPFCPDEDSPIVFLVGLPFLVLGIMWCYADAAQRDYRIGRFMALMLVLFFVAGLPLYLYSTRGIRALKPLAQTILLAAAMFACAYAMLVVTLLAGEFAGLWELAG